MMHPAIGEKHRRHILRVEKDCYSCTLTSVSFNIAINRRRSDGRARSVLRGGHKYSVFSVPPPHPWRAPRDRETGHRASAASRPTRHISRHNQQTEARLAPREKIPVENTKMKCPGAATHTYNIPAHRQIDIPNEHGISEREGEPSRKI